MEALFELCDLIAQNPKQFSEKLAWICNRCPQPELLLSGSPRVSRSHLNAVLAVARFLSKCGDSADSRPKSVILEFIRAIPSSFNRSFWPQAFSTSDSISSFFTEFLGYVSKSCDESPDFAAEVAGLTGEVIISAVCCYGAEDSGITRAFLLASSKNFPPILPSDANKLVTVLLEQLALPIPASPREHIPINSGTSSSQSSPLSANHLQPSQSNGSESSPGNEGASIVSGSSVSMNGGASIFGGFTMNDGQQFGQQFRQQVASFEEESVESLEKQEIAFKLITHVLDKVQIDTKLLEQIRFLAKRQLQSMSAFLKVPMSIDKFHIIKYFIYC